MIKCNFLIIMLMFTLISVRIFAQKNTLEVLGGFDGANPQNQEAIIREAPNRFRMNPFNEEGSNDSYYFRFTTKVINHSLAEKDIELLIDWPVLERRPNYPYNTYYYGDIGNWKWTYAFMDGITARVNITVPPGVTYISAYPGYNYEHYEEFIESLNPSNILEKWIEGKSFYSRNIWCVKITDSNVPDEKKHTILITSRNHPYETSGSYISEEIINYLQSEVPEAKKLIKENIVYLLPMMNPDGTALGMNQQTRPNG